MMLFSLLPFLVWAAAPQRLVVRDLTGKAIDQDKADLLTDLLISDWPF